MIAAEALAALRSIADELVRLEERCQQVLGSLPRSGNEAVIFEGHFPGDLPTELRTVVKSVAEGLRNAIE